MKYSGSNSLHVTIINEIFYFIMTENIFKEAQFLFVTFRASTFNTVLSLFIWLLFDKIM